VYNSKVNDRWYPAPIEAGPRPGVPAGATEDEFAASLREVFQVIWKRLWLILLVALLLVGAAVGFSLTQAPTFEASIKILVGQQRGITETPNDVIGLQQLTQTMTEGLNSRRVANVVIEQEGLRVTPEAFLADHLRVEQVNATQFIQVTYTDTDPQRAQRVANAVGEVFSEEIAEVSPSTNAITATLWDRAVVPEEPVSPNPLRTGLLALVVGLMLGVGLAFLLEYLDDSWRSLEEVERLTRVPTFGVIPNIQLPKSKKGGH
jgi:capsular polysaccharide biosynthesis protein